MQYAKFKIKPTDLKTSDYSTRVMNGPQVQEPEIWLLADTEGAVIVFPNRMYMWISSDTTKYILTEYKPEEQKSVTQSIDSDTLLKAIAIAQKPELVVTLLKD